MSPAKISELDRRAADSGLDRSKYLMRLVDEELAAPARKAKRRFASKHLLGKFSSSGSSNAKVRTALKGRSEKDR
jgi:hypothetical protein